MADKEQLDLITEDGVTAWNAWRTENPRTLTDLSGADLQGCFLDKGNFVATNLKDAVLKGARLGEANLTGANLTNADLRDTNLTGAKFINARLFDASFRGATLESASFKGAEFNSRTLGLGRLPTEQRAAMREVQVEAIPEDTPQDVDRTQDVGLPRSLVTNTTPIGRAVVMTTTFVGLPLDMHNQPIEIEKLVDWLGVTAVRTVPSGVPAEEYVAAVRQFLKEMIAQTSTLEDATDQALEAAVAILKATGVVVVQSPAKGLTMAVLAGASVGVALIQFPIGGEVVPMIIGGTVGGLFMIFMRSMDAFGQSFGKAAGKVAGESAGKALFGGEQIGLELWRELKMRPSESDLPETPKLSEAVQERLPHDIDSVDE